MIQKAKMETYSELFKTDAVGRIDGSYSVLSS